MSIKEISEKIKSKVGEREKDIFVGLLLLIVSFGAFGLGRLSKLEESKMPVKIESIDNTDNTASSIINNTNNTSNTSEILPFVASKNSTKYHRVDCPGAKAIKETNKIWFGSIEEARQAGLTPAGNCPGLE